MTETPGFDPFVILGVGPDADEVIIQLAYKARIRAVHPDRAGAAGLAQTKQLNAARDWLLDPVLRARLQGPAPPPTGSPTTNHPGPATRRGPRQRGGHKTGYDPARLDPFGFDFGPHTEGLQAFFRSIQALSQDERARVNYSLGDTRPVPFGAYDEYLGPRLWSRSQALRDAVRMIWESGLDEEPPLVSPLGRVLPQGLLVTNAYAQWILQSDFLRRELKDKAFHSDHVFDTFAARCTSPWQASIRQPRYGPNQPHVMAFLQAASSLSVEAADRLSRSWQRHMNQPRHGDGSGRIGPGVWLPAPANYPAVLKVSGYLAAIDASRIMPPKGLDPVRHDGFRYGLRLTGHVTALGLERSSGHDYLRPWRDATGSGRSLRRRMRLR